MRDEIKKMHNELDFNEAQMDVYWYNNYMYNKILDDYFRTYNKYMPMNQLNSHTYYNPENKHTSLPNYNEIINISQPLKEGMLLNPPNVFSISPIRNFSLGDKMRISKVCISHTGAHIDFPIHFIPSGKTLRDYEDIYGLDTFYGPAAVIEVPYNKSSIDVNFLKSIGKLPNRILFKTSNSKLYKKTEVSQNYVYVEPEAAEYIAENDVRLVGIDYLGIENPKSTTFETHKILLSKDILILEGIILNDIKEGTYTLSCFPLEILDSDFGPCRAVLIKY